MSNLTMQSLKISQPIFLVKIFCISGKTRLVALVICSFESCIHKRPYHRHIFPLLQICNSETLWQFSLLAVLCFKPCNAP